MYWPRAQGRPISWDVLLDWFVRVTEASEPLLQLLEVKPCASVVINIWWLIYGLVKVIQCILCWRVVYQQCVLHSCVRESLKEPAQWFHQDQLLWIHVVNTFCLLPSRTNSCQSTLWVGIFRLDLFLISSMYLCIFLFLQEDQNTTKKWWIQDVRKSSIASCHLICHFAPFLALQRSPFTSKTIWYLTGIVGGERAWEVASLLGKSSSKDDEVAIYFPAIHIWKLTFRNDIVKQQRWKS